MKARSPLIKVVVDEETIRESVNRDSSHCMIAEAVKKAFPEGTSISVDLQTIRVSNPKKRLRYTYLTPRRAQVSIIKFDQGMLPEPFAVNLRNGQVTKMSDSSKARMDARAQKVRSNKGKPLTAADAENPLRKASLVQRNPGTGKVPDRVGGKTPPMQHTKDKVPFSRRRAFGLRGIDM